MESIKPYQSIRENANPISTPRGLRSPVEFLDRRPRWSTRGRPRSGRRRRTADLFARNGNGHGNVERLRRPLRRGWPLRVSGERDGPAYRRGSPPLASIIARSIDARGEPFNFHAPIRRISAPRDSRLWFTNVFLIRTKAKGKLMEIDLYRRYHLRDLNIQSFNYYRIHRLFYALCLLLASIFNESRWFEIVDLFFFLVGG